jgi:energy-coupling factor transporter ATP-binding protein EcfA2
MRVSKILIKGFQQFENFQLDLTNPETGEPLDRICLIGPNGTGKSTILACILWILRSMSDMPIFPGIPGSDPGLNNFFQSLSQSKSIFNRHPVFLAIKIHTNGEAFFAHIPLDTPQSITFYQEDVESYYEWEEFWKSESAPEWNRFCLPFKVSGLPIQNLSGLEDLIIHEPSDQSLTLTQDPPHSSLDDALKLFQDFPVFHSISVASSSDFWKLLIYLIKKRESDYLTFLNQPENRDKTIGQLDDEFSPHNPQILLAIADLWDGILGKCGLELDARSAKTPVQLNENLQAYIRSKNTGKQLSYNQLSSGIRNYIFKLGYIKSLYFNRETKRGFLLIDEPENCLYPDLLYDLMDDYWSIIENTQTFVSTHSPIIAAQFEPYERFHLDFDDRGYVTATRGVSPIGDDPNDVLYRDFQVRSIYGKKGLEKWERFRELRQLIRTTDDPTVKETLMSEYTEIANAYNFPVPR